MVRENGEYKGKINWFTNHQLIEKGLLESSKKVSKLSHEELETLRDKCVNLLKKEGFVFFNDSIGYRIEMQRKGYINDFGVQFWYIK